MKDQTTEPIKRTAGEKHFDWMTYGGIGYLANVVISIGAMWAVDRTKAGKDFLYASSKTLSSLTGINARALRPQIRYTSLLSGGFAVLAPIKMLEDHKLELVKAYDQKHYEAVGDVSEHLRAAYDRLEIEPRQSWSSVLGSRLLSMAPFYAFTSIAMRENQWLARQTGGRLFAEKLITKAARSIDKAVHSSNPQALAEIAAKNKKYPNYTVNSFIRGEMERPVSALADYTITEAMTSSIVAGFLYIFTRITAPFLGNAPTEQPRHFSPVAQVEGLKKRTPASAAPTQTVTPSPTSSVDAGTMAIANNTVEHGLAQETQRR